KIKSLSEGKVSPAILTNTTKTFMELVKLADFNSSPQESQATDVAPIEAPEIEPPSFYATDVPLRSEPMGGAGAGPTLVYRIEIVLPAVRDQGIYDAIFRSAREHLLK